MNEAMVVPVPGNRPSSAPTPVPRNTGNTERLKSSRLSIRSRQRNLYLIVSLLPFLRSARFEMISPKAKRPIASTTKLIPSERSCMPKVKRYSPELTSIPTMPSSRPSRTMAMPFKADSRVSITAARRPSTIREKYSVGPNSSAHAASGGANRPTTTSATHDPKNDAKVVETRAGPARPCFAMGLPSSTTTAEAPSPGMFISIEVIEPPYMAP